VAGVLRHEAHGTVFDAAMNDGWIALGRQHHQRHKRKLEAQLFKGSGAIRIATTHIENHKLDGGRAQGALGTRQIAGLDQFRLGVEAREKIRESTPKERLVVHDKDFHNNWYLQLPVRLTKPEPHSR